MKDRWILAPLFISLIAATFLFAAPNDGPETDAHLTLVIVLDGVRPEEFFHGSDPLLETSHVNREDLFPYLAGELQKDTDATILGEGDHPCLTTNPHGISLPAYADILAGARQNEVSSNDFRGKIGQDTLLDRLKAAHVPPGLAAVFTSWKNIERVASRENAPFLVEAGLQNNRGEAKPPWPNARYDDATMASVFRYLESASELPRFLFVALNDADEWAHRGDYPAYLDAIRRQDRFVREIMNRLPSDRTALFVTTDHGRGKGKAWKHHGAAYAGSEKIWAVVHIPPDLKRRYAGAVPIGECNHLTLSHAFEETLKSEQRVLPIAGVPTKFMGF